MQYFPDPAHTTSTQLWSTSADDYSSTLSAAKTHTTLPAFNSQRFGSSALVTSPLASRGSPSSYSPPSSASYLCAAGSVVTSASPEGLWTPTYADANALYSPGPATPKRAPLSANPGSASASLSA
ncbi:putative urocanate hydratase, partial [Frankliniella fusca]